MDWLIPTPGFTTPMRGVKLTRLAGCCSRALVQAARTRSFAILCNLVMNATCDRCVWYVDCSSDRVLSVAVQCYVVTSLSAPGEHPSRRPASPSVAEGDVAWTPIRRRLGPRALHPAFGLARTPTPSLRQEQQFCTAEVIAAIVSIAERSSACRKLQQCRALVPAWSC